jgi:hypothetical protein
LRPQENPSILTKEGFFIFLKFKAYLTTSKSGFSFDPDLRWYADEQMDGFFLGL